MDQWLNYLQRWSTLNPSHAPIVITIDLKDNLTDNRSYAEGNLAHLNDTISQSIHRLLTPIDRFTQFEELQGGFICVLSGDQRTRSLIT